MDYEPQSYSDPKYNMWYIVTLREQSIKPDNSPPNIAFRLDFADHQGKDKEYGKGW